MFSGNVVPKKRRLKIQSRDQMRKWNIQHSSTVSDLMCHVISWLSMAKLSQIKHHWCFKNIFEKPHRLQSAPYHPCRPIPMTTEMKLQIIRAIFYEVQWWISCIVVIIWYGTASNVYISPPSVVSLLFIPSLYPIYYMIYFEGYSSISIFCFCFSKAIVFTYYILFFIMHITFLNGFLGR